MASCFGEAVPDLHQGGPFQEHEEKVQGRHFGRNQSSFSTCLAVLDASDGWESKTAQGQITRHQKENETKCRPDI